MKRTHWPAALLVAAHRVILAQDKALKELEGTYKVTHLEKGRQGGLEGCHRFDEDHLQGGRSLIKVADEEKKAKIKVDSSKTPNTIDVIPADGPEKEDVPGIYKIEKGGTHN